MAEIILYGLCRKDEPLSLDPDNAGERKHDHHWTSSGCCETENAGFQLVMIV